MTDRLKTVVDELEEKREVYEQRSDVDEKIGQAETGVKNLYKRLIVLQNRLEELEFYAELSVIVGIYGHKRELDAVAEAYQQSNRVVDLSEHELLDIVVDQRLESYQEKVNGAAGQVEDAVNEIQNKLQEFQDKWQDNTSSARQVLEVADGSRDLEVVLDNIDRFVDRRMWDSNNNIHELERDWEKYMETWEAEAVDWGALKSKHDLHDTTVDYLKRFSKGEEFTLSALPEPVVADLTTTEDLKQAFTLSL